MPLNPERVLVYRKAPNEAAKFESKATSNRVRVGIWDMDTCAGALPALLDILEDAQTYFSFYQVEAPYQTGLTAPGAHVARLWRKRTGGWMSKYNASNNVLSQPIFDTAKPVLDALPVAWLVVVIKAMIADDSDRRDAWYGLFSTHKRKTIMVSTFELRRYAAEAGRPFESAVVVTVLSALLAAMFPKIEFHDETTGSIFDFCEVRSDIVKSIKLLRIDDKNARRISAPALSASETILSVLQAYRGEMSSADMRRQKVYYSRETAPLKPVAHGAGEGPFRTGSKALLPAAGEVAFATILKKLQGHLSKPAGEPQRQASAAPKKKRKPAKRVAKTRKKARSLASEPAKLKLGA